MTDHVQCLHQRYMVLHVIIIWYWYSELYKWKHKHAKTKIKLKHTCEKWQINIYRYVSTLLYKISQTQQIGAVIFLYSFFTPKENYEKDTGCSRINVHRIRKQFLSMHNFFFKSRIHLPLKLSNYAWDFLNIGKQGHKCIFNFE